MRVSSREKERAAGFNEYFKSLTGSPENTFLEEYWQSLGCHALLVSNFGECFIALNMTFKQESYVPFVVDAVKVVAAALNKYIEVREGEKGRRLRRTAGICPSSSATSPSEDFKAIDCRNTIGMCHC